MNRNVYISDGSLALAEYVAALDDIDCYDCWRDEETQRGYNHKSTETLEEFSASSIRTRFIATIVRESDGACVGSIFLSQEGTPPDLAIMIYPQHRRMGYGARAFALGVKYCFDVLELDCVYAGCYPHNAASMKMLLRCGFAPHPEGNVVEKHYLTGEEVIQMDFVIENKREK